MAISPAQARRERAQLLRAIDREIKAKNRARLVELRAQVRRLTASRRSAIAKARATCAEAREVPTQRQAIAWQREAKRQARAACVADRRDARALADPVARARAERAAEAKEQRTLRQIERGLRRKEKLKRRPGLRKVPRDESDDEVRGNIPPELVLLFERVKRSIRGSDRMSRTEAFLQYAHEHPDEELAAIEDRTDEVIRELERRQAMPNPKKKTKRAKKTSKSKRNNPESRKAQKHRLLARIRREATTAAVERLSGHIAKAMRHDHAVDRMTREAERQGWGDNAYEAEERGRRAGDRAWRKLPWRQRGLRNPAGNPNRPPRRWFDHCLASVEAHRYARDPAAVCGAAWWKMPAHERAAIVRRWERGSPRQRRVAVAVAKAERNRATRGRAKKKTRA